MRPHSGAFFLLGCEMLVLQMHRYPSHTPYPQCSLLDHESVPVLRRVRRLYREIPLRLAYVPWRSLLRLFDYFRQKRYFPVLSSRVASGSGACQPERWLFDR